jgi:hypothetical protein
VTSKTGQAIRAVVTLGSALAVVAACHSKTGARATVSPPSDTTATVSPASDTTDLADLRSKIRTLVGDAACTSASQCRLVAYGSKPCGGPWQYLVYSTTTTDSTALEVAVARYNAREAEVNRLYHRMSDCSVAIRPKITVVDGHCKIAP